MPWVLDGSMKLTANEIHCNLNLSLESWLRIAHPCSIWVNIIISEISHSGFLLSVLDKKIESLTVAARIYYLWKTKSQFHAKQNKSCLPDPSIISKVTETKMNFEKLLSQQVYNLFQSSSSLFVFGSFCIGCVINFIFFSCFECLFLTFTQINGR